MYVEFQLYYNLFYYNSQQLGLRSTTLSECNTLVFPKNGFKKKLDLVRYKSNLNFT